MAVSRGRENITDVLDFAADNWCMTEIKPIKFSYMWTIKNFSYCHKEKLGVLQSSTFCVETQEKSNWCLRLHPNGLDEDSRSCVSIFLKLLESPKKEISVKYKFSVVVNKQEREISEIERPQKFVYGSSWGFKKFVEKELLLSEVNGLLQDDNLTVKCDILVVGEQTNRTSDSDTNPKVKVPKETIGCDFGKLLDNGWLSDVTLSADGCEYKAHKIILGARSPVFKAMFQHNLNENKKNLVEIYDVDPEVLWDMLQFVYTGKVTNDENFAELLVAADKYALERLKAICEEHLVKTLTSENLSEILILADVYSADQLKRHAIHFFTKHAPDVMVTQGWKTIVTDHPHIVQILMADGFASS